MTYAPSSPGRSFSKPRPGLSLIRFIRLIRLAGLAGAALFLLAGCSTARQTGQFLWPGFGDSYIETTRKWTRSDSAHTGLELTCTATALYQSREWRAAYIERYAEVYALSGAEKAAMAADQAKAAETSEGFILAIGCSDPQRSHIRQDRQSWQTALLRGESKTYPEDFLRLDWPESKFEALLPGYTPWRSIYQLRFPASSPGPFTLSVSGPDGAMRLTWD